MLKITIPAKEYYDAKANEFISIKETTLRLEHSLISISKWESKWKKPFMAPKSSSKYNKTPDEVLDYISCMSLDQEIPVVILRTLSSRALKEIEEYIGDQKTATWFSEDGKKAPSREIITSELIYYWMIACNVPIECEKWHLSRLLTLIKICSIKNSPPKKMSGKDWAKQRKALNASRRQQLGTKG